ncbi:unnamed protein product [Parajaminaea phylloscopi]
MSTASNSGKDGLDVATGSEPVKEVTVAKTEEFPPAVAPLAASLESTLALLLRKLGFLLSRQAQLRFQDTATHGDGLQSGSRAMPGWAELLAAADKWHRDVNALSRWVSRAQDALAIEHKHAQRRDALRALKAEQDAAEAKAAAEAAASQAASSADESKSAGAAAEEPGPRLEAVIDLTADDDDSSKATGNAKRPREDDVNDAPAETAEGTVPRESSREAADTAESMVKRQRLQGSDGAPGSQDPSGSSATADPTPNSADSANVSLAKGVTTEGATSGPFGPLSSEPAGVKDQAVDLSSLGIPDLSGVDLSAFMNMDAAGGEDGGDPSVTGLTGFPPAGEPSMDADAADQTDAAGKVDDGGAGGTNGIATETGAGEALGGDFSSALGDLNFPSADGLGGMGFDGMDFSSALQGVDWNSLLQSFEGGQS